MDYPDFINDFFAHLRCANCHEFFKEDSIQLIRKEADNIIVKIVCARCEKNLGLAIIGIDRTKYNNSMKFSEDSSEIPVSINTDADPINYNDVIEAHEFFNTLGDDWIKYLPEQK